MQKEEDTPSVVISIQSSAHDEITTRKQRLRTVFTFFSLQLSLFMSALDNTIVATSLPTIGSEFHAMPIASWIVNSYTLTFVAFQPLTSKLSDIFGRKLIIMSGMVLFLIGSVLCAVSKTMIMLIVCRAIQGIGAASLSSLVNIIISDIIPLEKRGSYQGLISIVYTLANVSGPVIGGSLTEHLTWRWNFYINLPIGGVALTLLFFFLHLPTEKQDFKEKLKRIDYIGNFLVVASATLLLLAMNFGGQMFPWKSAAVIVPFVLAVILVVVLVVVEAKFAKEPLLPPRLFKNRSVVAVLLINLFFGMSFYSILFYLPIYFQAVLGDSAMWSGIHSLPLALANIITAIPCGLLITKFGVYRLFLAIAMTLLTLGIGLFGLFSADTSWFMIEGIIVICGVGIGSFFPSTTIAIQAAIERRDIAIATSLQYFIRYLGSSLGIAISSAILNSTLKKDLMSSIPTEYAQLVLQSSHFIRTGLPSEYFDIVIKIYTESIQSVWHIIVIMSGLGVLSSLFVKQYSLRRKAASAAQQVDNRENNVPT